MTKENKDLLMKLLQQYKLLGISDQIDFDKFYLYSIITHSTAIEGSTVTEVEVQLLVMPSSNNSCASTSVTVEPSMAVECVMME